LQAKDVLLRGLLSSRFSTAEACCCRMHRLRQGYSAKSSKRRQASKGLLKRVSQATEDKETDSQQGVLEMRQRLCFHKSLEVLHRRVQISQTPQDHAVRGVRYEFSAASLWRQVLQRAMRRHAKRRKKPRANQDSAVPLLRKGFPKEI